MRGQNPSSGRSSAARRRQEQAFPGAPHAGLACPAPEPAWPGPSAELRVSSGPETSSPCELDRALSSWPQIPVSPVRLLDEREAACGSRQGAVKTRRRRSSRPRDSGFIRVGWNLVIVLFQVSPAGFKWPAGQRTAGLGDCWTPFRVSRGAWGLRLRRERPTHFSIRIVFTSDHLLSLPINPENV